MSHSSISITFNGKENILVINRIIILGIYFTILFGIVEYYGIMDVVNIFHNHSRNMLIFLLVGFYL